VLVSGDRCEGGDDVKKPEEDFFPLAIRCVSLSQRTVGRSGKYRAADGLI